MTNGKITQTNRLLLRQFTHKDAPFILKLLNTPGWLQYIGDSNVKSVEDAENYINNILIKGYATNGFGFWLVGLKDNATAVGMCGLVKREGLDNVDIGFAMLPDYYGKGYAYEAAFATLQYAENFLKLNDIVAICNADNVASGKLLEKLGFSFERMIRLPNIDEDVRLFVNAPRTTFN